MFFWVIFFNYFGFRALVEILNKVGFGNTILCNMTKPYF